MGWTGNFDLAAAGQLPQGRRGRIFSDSEVYKYLEAVSWEIGRSGDEALEQRLQALVARVGAAQEADGYLGTAFGRPGQPPRWSDLEWGHELYCVGHLCQAAVARERTRPGAEDGLLLIARRAADLICQVFGVGGIPSVCGHPGIEPALVELARVTGEPRYLEQAALFVERRGRGSLPDIEWGRSYFQDDVPVREAPILRGHTVRAGYLAAGAVDVAVETGDTELLDALAAQWDATVARRTYLTGGQGSHHQDEAFGDDWELPPDRAYSETCASVGSVMFSWRLLLSRADPRYADLIERTLYNVVATSPSSDGTAFFYANTLHQRRAGTPGADSQVSIRASSSLRAAWFEVSCCPPNVARTLAALNTYLATVDETGLQIHQYAPCTIRTQLPGGRPVAVEVETDYPHDGLIRVRVTGDADQPWTLTLRVPSWAAPGASLACMPIDGPQAVETVGPGSAAVRRAFRNGDLVELRLPVQPRITDDVAQVRLDPSQPPRLLGDDVIVTVRRTVPSTGDWPYRTDLADPLLPGRIPVRLSPYHEWAERGPTTMRVWLPLAAE